MPQQRDSRAVLARAGRDSISRYPYRLPQGIARLHCARLNASDTGRYSLYREPARAFSAIARYRPLSPALTAPRCNTAPRRHHDVIAAIARDVLWL
jgi:hypothetical protein